MSHTIDGIIVLDKPPHITSACAVGVVKRLLPRGTRIGHGGTLDPFATGILLLLVGKATRSFENITSWKKTYDATIKLGFNTATDDPDSPETPYIVAGASHNESIVGRCGAHPPAHPSLEQIRQASTRFVGDIEQIPPAFSALKISGKRASDHAREGREVQVKPRLVRIHTFNVTDYSWPDVRVSIGCGRGTYIRSIARALGNALNTGGYLTQLRRTRVGPFGIQDAMPLEKLRKTSILDAIHCCKTVVDSV